MFVLTARARVGTPARQHHLAQFYDIEARKHWARSSATSGFDVNVACLRKDEELYTRATTAYDLAAQHGKSRGPPNKGAAKGKSALLNVWSGGMFARRARQAKRPRATVVPGLARTVVRATAGRVVKANSGRVVTAAAGKMGIVSNGKSIKAVGEVGRPRRVSASAHFAKHQFVHTFCLCR